MDSMFPNWQLPYLDAVEDGSEESLRGRVDHAERAICKRFEELSRTSGRETEKQAIRKALDTLHDLKRDRLDFPRSGESPVSFL